MGKIISEKHLTGVGKNLLTEILNYEIGKVTCPSNYLFRKEILENNAVKFDIDLSSSADRFFLINLSFYTNGENLNRGGYLYYRVHNKSMSNNLTLTLIKDNILFKKKVLSIVSIDAKTKNKFHFKTNYIFSGGYYKLNYFFTSMLFFAKAFYYGPIDLLKQVRKKK